MATFRRKLYHDGKISPGWGARAPLFTILPSQAKLWSTLQLRGRYTPPISPLPPLYLLHLAFSCTMKIKIIFVKIVKIFAQEPSNRLVLSISF
jgi:hypothetical protein